MRLLRHSALLAIVAWGCSDTSPSHSPEPGPLMKEVRRAPLPRRTSRALFSVPVAYAPCGAEAGLRCAAHDAGLGAEWARLAGRLSAAVDAGVDPDVFQAGAVTDLLAGGAGKSLDRSISYLEMATRIAPTSDRFVDLSAAYTAKAARDDDASATIAALDAAARAAARDVLDPAARFNMALALRELGLFSAAAAQLDRFIELAGGSAWADEARSYRAGISLDTIVMPAVASITEEEMLRFARAHPAEGRQVGWERLAAWGRALADRDAATAERELRLADAAARGIAATQGDPSLADAVHAIRNAEVPAQLASAHVAFIEAQQLWRANRNAEAEALYLQAQRRARESPALHAWATHGYGNNRLGFQDLTKTEMVMRELLESPAARRYPALEARSLWTLGVTLLRLRRFDHGVSAVARSRAIYARLGEAESEGWMTAELGEAAGLGGDSRAAYGFYAQALRTMHEYPLSSWRHNVLLLLSRAAAADGFTAAAAVIDAENEAADRAANRLPQLAEDQLTRARRALAAGDRVAAAAAIAEGRQVAAQMPVSGARRQLEADLAVGEAGLAPDRPETRQLLDSAVAYFTTIGNFSKQLRAYAARAAWSLRSGDEAAAAADLDAALTIYEQRRDSVSDATQKSLLVEQARGVVDDLTMIHLRHNDARGALTVRERGREALDVGATLPTTTSPVVELAVIGDTLVTLVTRGDETKAFRAGIDTARLNQDVELLLASFERDAPAAVWEPVLERLHDLIVGPIIGGAITDRDSLVTIVTTPELSRIPFAALRDARDGRYLVERHALRFARSLRQAARDPATLPARPRALIVADPAVDRRAFPGLSPLPGATQELRAIATFLEQPTILRGAAADTASVQHALASAQILHFAGHALFDDAQPQRSQLVMGSHGLSAQRVATMRLPSLALVVLSACETTRSPVGGGAGFLGLTESFAAAGAGGVVGSLWRVGDAPTEQLMRSFYESLSHGNAPAFALQAAQRSMASTPPSAWAAFRYVGN